MVVAEEVETSWGGLPVVIELPDVDPGRVLLRVAGNQGVSDSDIDGVSGPTRAKTAETASVREFAARQTDQSLRFHPNR